MCEKEIESMSGVGIEEGGNAVEFLGALVWCRILILSSTSSST